MRSVPQPGGWFSVEGLASKRNSHPLTQRVCVPAPSLHSRYLLLRYYEPVRLPYGAASRVMHSPRALAALPATPPGLPGSSTDLSPCAVPNHPGEPDGCSLPLLHRRYQASSRMADWPLPVYITRPNRVHLCYGSRVRLARLRQADCSAPRSLGYLLNGQLTGQAPFSLQDQPGLSWRSIHCLLCMRRLIHRLTGCALDTGGAFGRARGRRHEGQCRRHPRKAFNCTTVPHIPY
jgi:hypothetical protein